MEVLDHLTRCPFWKPPLSGLLFSLNVKGLNDEQARLAIVNQTGKC